MSKETLSAWKKLRALSRVAQYRPLLTASIVLLSLLVAALEGVGLGFILPIIEVARGTTEGDASGPMQVFVKLYDFLGVPFTLEFIVLGVGVVIAVRYMASFLMQWLTATLRVNYIRTLRVRAFSNALDARIEYFDKRGSDEILNAIITQTQYGGRTIQRVVNIMELALTTLIYILISLYIAPVLMFVIGAMLGGVMYGLRYMLESGYSVGGRVADANERLQKLVQAGTQGIRDVKLFGLDDELFETFQEATDQYTDALVTQRRNQAAINNASRFSTAAAVFGLIYVGIKVVELPLAGLGVFLFSMFRLGPKMSNLNDQLYQAENDLPHLVRTQEFIERIKGSKESDGDKSVSAPVDRVVFEDVTFEYESSGKQVLRNVSFDVERGELIAFVGPSGAGKSTIVSLLVRMYEPEDGRIVADDTLIEEFDLAQWRSRVSVVRQNPYIFNDTLRYNVTIGNRKATQMEIEEVCEIAQVTEFLDGLPNGYDTVLGDAGIRLSGGQKQRVAIARALLKKSDLLILDEATSDLDSQLEEQVHSGIRAMEHDYAIVAIAHQLSTVTNANRIHMMESGQIVEAGAHRKLLNQGGKYENLYATQS